MRIEEEMDQNSEEYSEFQSEMVPILFGDNFNADNISWKKLDRISYSAIGKILVCHLLVESHLDKYIELRTPRGFDFTNAKLTFSQKVSLLEKDHILVRSHFVKPVKSLNRIRNLYAHDIEAKLGIKNLEEIIKFLKVYEKRNKLEFSLNEPFEGKEVEIVEKFTTIFCSFFAGACTALTGYFHKTDKLKAEKS